MIVASLARRAHSDVLSGVQPMAVTHYTVARHCSVTTSVCMSAACMFRYPLLLDDISCPMWLVLAGVTRRRYCNMIDRIVNGIIS